MSSLALRMARQRQDHERRRFARDQAVDQAIRNYLAIALRAHSLPQVLARGTTPHEGEAARSLLESGDPGDLMALLDLFNERPVLHGATATLRQLHAHVAGHGSALPGEESARPHPAVVRGYGEEALAAPAIRNLVRQRLGIDRAPASGFSVGDMLGFANSNLPLGDERAEAARHVQNSVNHGDLHALLMAHVLLSARPQDNEARSGVGGVESILAQHVHPALWHYGETGELPR